MISSYNLQANEMIEVEHRPIIDTLLKMTQKGTIIEMNEWITHLLTILLADRMTIKISTEMTSFQILYEEKAMLLIKLNILI